MPVVAAALRRVRLLTTSLAGLAIAAGVLGTAPAAPAAAATSPRPQGLDVSRWQSAGPGDTCAAVGINWLSVSRTTRSFAYIRATRTKRGVTGEDACFRRNWANASASGIYRGAYHYAVPSAQSGSAVRDARAFVAVTGPMQHAGDLPPVLDLETTGGLQPTALAAWTNTWPRTVRSLTGRQPMIYTFPSFWRTAMADSRAFHAYPLWIAHWTSVPSVPGGWSTHTVHQYSATGRVAGIAGDVDLNVFNGTAAQLQAFAHPATYVTAGTTNSKAYRGSAWHITGNVRTTSRVPLKNVTVQLSRRVGTGPWKKIATARTSAHGVYGFTLRPGAAATYRVQFPGGPAFAASSSPLRSHTISNRLSTTTTLAISASRVRKGQTVTLSGRLARTSGTRLASQPVYVYQQVGRGKWTRVRALKTSATAARFSITVRPAVPTTYRVTFYGSYANRPSSSVSRAVRLR